MDPFHATRQFHDPDEAARAISGTWLEISVLGPASGAWSITDVCDEGYRLVYGRMASPFSGCGAILRDSMTLCWPMGDDTGEWSINGRRILGDTLMRLESGVEYATLTSRPLHWAALVVPHIDHEGPSAFGARDIERDAMARIRGITRTAVHLARTDPPSSKRVLAALAATVGSLASPGQFAHSPHGERDIGKLIALLQSQHAEPLHPGGLARLAGVDERTLRRAFASRFGISVGRYLRLRRLNDVRRDLMSPASAPASVTQAATKHGFFDLGRFAANYRRTFGENPSTTLSRTRRALRIARIAADRSAPGTPSS